QVLNTALTVGDHFLAGYGGSVTWFKINTDGTVSYDAALEGILTGQGTTSLVARGLSVAIDPRALNATALSVDYTPYAADQAFQVQLTPGWHFLIHDGNVSWFTVNADRSISGDPAVTGGIRVLTPIEEKYASIPDAAQVLGNALGGEQE